jgi:hypothetical protein
VCNGSYSPSFGHSNQELAIMLLTIMSNWHLFDSEQLRNLAVKRGKKEEEKKKR